ncbi:MAG: DUF3618 domain-containing protein [Kineosporiaceae bacterium]
MGAQSEELKQQIEQTRNEISRDVDALAYKASPSRIVGSRVDRAKSGLTGLKEKVMGSSSDGTGAAGAVGTVKDRTGSAVHGVTGAVGSGASHVSDAGHSVASGVSSATSTVASSVSGAASAVGHTTEDVASTVRRQAEGNPLAAGVIAFGVGWLVSSLLPATSAETRAASNLGDLASDKGAPVIERAKAELRTVGAQMGESLKSSATEAAAAVKSTAAEGVQAVREEGMGAAQDVKDTAKGDDTTTDSTTSLDVTDSREEVGVAAGYGYSDTPSYTGESGSATNRI